MLSKLSHSIKNLENYIETNQYRGYDIYDSLMSPLFKLPFLKNRHVRFFSQQFFRRIPLNFRPILRTPKGNNPVTLGLCIEAYSHLMQKRPDQKQEYLKRIKNLCNELVQMQSHNYSGICWGYDFDWESRYSTMPAFTPTIVATGIITNALFSYFSINKDKNIPDIINSSLKFVLKDLNRIPQNVGFCFSYSPFDYQSVFNATMKGVRLLAQGYSITKNEEYKSLARETLDFVMHYQQDSGAWIYSHSDDRTFIDNYHTAYILDCLQGYIKLTGDEKYRNNLEFGFQYYLENFFHKNKIPKTYKEKRYPVDSTAIAQSIITLLNFNETELAVNVANWVIDNFQAKDGHIYYRKYRYFIQKISYMRWSNAWMFVALTKLLASFEQE